MFPANSLLKTAPRAVNQVRSMSVLSGPPKVRISFPEKVVHGVAIAVGMSAIPAWVLVNIKNYRTHD